MWANVWAKRKIGGARQCPDNGHNLQELCCRELGEIVMVPRKSALLIDAIAGGAAWALLGVQARGWARAPADFEECADKAEKAASKEAKSSALTECNAKFAGRRKPGGGYTYFDFMQNRSFDIAGPNPTPEEQKKIDEQYTAYLESQRRSSITAAFAAKQQQVQQAPQGVQQASLRSETEKIPVPVASPVKQAARIKAANCAKSSFSCEWPRLSEGIDGLKKLFNVSPSKGKRG